MQDTLTFSVDLAFPSGTCDQHFKGYNLNGNKIEAYAIHCLGMLTYICYHTDTFKINPLPAGSYSFHFQLDAGMLPSPCSPGIIPAQFDSITFVVSPVNGLNAAAEDRVHLALQGNELIVRTGQPEQKCMIALYDLNGKMIRSEWFDGGFLRMNVSDLSDGTYLYSVSTVAETLKQGSFVKR